MTDATNAELFQAEIRQLENEFTHLIGHIRRSYRDSANRVSPGLLPGTYKVLSFVASDGPLTASEIAERLLLDKGHLSRMLKDLDERGLIQREADPADRRSTVVTLSEVGRERFSAARRPSRDGLAIALSGFDPAEIATTSRVLRALYERMSTTLAESGNETADAELAPTTPAEPESTDPAEIAPAEPESTDSGSAGSGTA